MNPRPPSVLNIASPCLASEWRQWRREWAYYATASEISAKPPAVQVAIFFNCAGRGAQEIASHFTDWTEDNGLNALLERFQAFCIPRQNIVLERFNFYSRHQQSGESVAQFVDALRSLAATCDFPDREDIIRDRIAMGVRDRRIQRELLKTPTLTLTQALNIALAEEAAGRDVRVITGECL